MTGSRERVSHSHWPKHKLKIPFSLIWIFLGPNIPSIHCPQDLLILSCKCSLFSVENLWQLARVTGVIHLQWIWCHRLTGWVVNVTSFRCANQRKSIPQPLSSAIPMTVPILALLIGPECSISTTLAAGTKPCWASTSTWRPIARTPTPLCHKSFLEKCSVPQR